MKASSIRGIPRWQPRKDKHEEIIFTTQECIKMQRDTTHTQGKSFHGATKEITKERQGGRERKDII